MSAGLKVGSFGEIVTVIDLVMIGVRRRRLRGVGGRYCSGGDFSRGGTGRAILLRFRDVGDSVLGLGGWIGGQRYQEVNALAEYFG